MDSRRHPLYATRTKLQHGLEGIVRLTGLFAIAVCLTFSSVAEAQERWPEPDPEMLARARALLAEVPLIDGHNDLPSSLIDLVDGNLDRIDLSVRQPELPADIPRLREGMVGGQFWSVFTPSEAEDSGTALNNAIDEFDVVHEFVSRYPEFELASTADDILRIHGEGKIASMIGVEGGHMIENSLGALRIFHRLGARYMTLSHFGSNDWADAATDRPIYDGLTEFGEEVVRELNRVGIFVDLSHVSAETMKDALRVSMAPVIYSHSGARAINAHVRNVPDDVLRLVAENGGVVMVDFVAGYVPPTPEEWRNLSGPEGERIHRSVIRSPDEPAWSTRRNAEAERLRVELDDQEEIDRRLASWIERNPAPRGNVGDVADHIDHIREVAGIDHIGIGSDFYDNGESSMAYGLEDVTRFPVLIAELLRRDYTEEEVKKIAGLNLIRAMREMEQAAARLRRER